MTTALFSAMLESSLPLGRRGERLIYPYEETPIPDIARPDSLVRVH